MGSRTWMTLCVLLALGCSGGHKPPTDNGPDLPFPPLGGEGDGTVSLRDRDGGPEPDGGMDTGRPDGGMDMPEAGSAGSNDAGTGGMAGATGGAGGESGSGGQPGGAGGASGGGPDAGSDDAGMPGFVPNGPALVGSWAAQYKVVLCSAEVTEELMAACDAGTCSTTTLNIDADLKVTGSGLISSALGASWSDDTLTQAQKDTNGTESELTLWFVDENHILGRMWSAGSTFTSGFEVCIGLRATRM